MKRLSATILALVMVFALCACGQTAAPAAGLAADDADAPSAAATDEAAKETVTINVVSAYGGVKRDNYEKAIAEYEAASGNAVIERQKAEISSGFEAGAEPDVLLFFSDADVEPLISAGMVVTIDTIRAEYPDFAANMKDSLMTAAADGTRYAVPVCGWWENMLVNKSVLYDCGVADPGPDYTWDQFLADCRIILDNGYTPIACSIAEEPGGWFEFAVMNNGSAANQPAVPTLDADGRLVEDEVSAKWIAALDDIKYLYECGFFQKNTLTADNVEAEDMFAQGAAAFFIGDSAKVSDFTGNYGDELDSLAVSYVPAKGERKATEIIGGITAGCFITEKAWNDPTKRDAAVGFVSYITSDDVLITLVTTELTALRSGAKPSGLNMLQQSAADANANITAAAGAVEDNITDEAWSELCGSIQNVVTGKMTAHDAVESAIKHN